VNKKLQTQQADLARFRELKQRLELKSHEAELLEGRIKQSRYYQVSRPFLFV
jgi:hypothetical protein